MEIPSTMRALVKRNASTSFEIVEIPVPQPKEGELLVQSKYVGICGSDIALYKWTEEAQAQKCSLPFTPGHEASGIVVRSGSNTTMKPDTRVAIENHFYCDNCYQCKDNRRGICNNMNQFGFGNGTIYGGCMEYFLVKEKYCYKLETNISLKDAALLEPLGVAHNACENLDIIDTGSPKHKENVLIIGCGTVGLFAIGICKYIGIKNIIACDITNWKLDLAKKMGANVVVNSEDFDRLTKIIKVCLIIYIRSGFFLVRDFTH